MSAFVFTLPPGRWAVGVSGGADSVALARLAVAAVRSPLPLSQERVRERVYRSASDEPDAPPSAARLVLAHLDHQLRGAESDGDAAFVVDLANSLGVPAEIGRRSDVEHQLAAASAGRRMARNPSARYRAARLAFFAGVVRRHALNGVLLAHHADDQAETVLLRRQRGSGPAFLAGIRPRTRIDGLLVVRPLLHVRRDALRDYLRSIGQPWREDASNASPAYRRNVVRRQLADDEALTQSLLRQAADALALRRSLDRRAPSLPARFPVSALIAAGKPDPAVAEYAVRQWLVARGAPPDRISPAVCRRLIAQATDMAAAPRQHYPGRLLVRRREKHIDVLPEGPTHPPV